MSVVSQANLYISYAALRPQIVQACGKTPISVDYHNVCLVTLTLRC